MCRRSFFSSGGEARLTAEEVEGGGGDEGGVVGAMRTSRLGAGCAFSGALATSLLGEGSGGGEGLFTVSGAVTGEGEGDGREGDLTAFREEENQYIPPPIRTIRRGITIKKIIRGNLFSGWAPFAEDIPIIPV